MSLIFTIREAVTQAIQELWPDIGEVTFDIEYPPRMSFGEYSVNAAMKITSRVGKPPREIADMLAEKLRGIANMKDVIVEGGGFINFYVQDSYLLSLLKKVQNKKEFPLDSSLGKGQHVNIEFISANPTGPLTFANGRGGFYGDVLARILEKCGYVVEREYYFNDGGKQIEILADSVVRKYFKQHGLPVAYPESCYQGDYIDELAASLRVPNYNLAKTEMGQIREKIRDQVVQKMMKQIKETIERKMHISFDTYFSEQSLTDPDGLVDQVLVELREKEYVYEKDGALWVRTSAFGDDKDRVIRKSDGQYTYLMPDIAYHINKLRIRAFDHAITIVGADHNADRMYYAMDMFGLKDRLIMIVMQLVRLIEDGKEVKMSKRKGTYITMDEVIDDVGHDPTRFFFLQYAPNTHMDFDLNLAKERSEKNPVYYIQYAHARMCSILKMVDEKKMSVSKEYVLSDVTRRLGVLMLRWPEVVAHVADTRAVHSLTQFALDVARATHEWYDKERVLTSDGKVNATLLIVTDATKFLLHDILATLGISAPERME